jgi:hypothetical protein
MASAIGIHPTYPSTGLPILSSAGGVVDGESVEDFIYQFKDLIPVRPNGIGFNLSAGINSGIPSWGTLDAQGTGSGTAMTGGWPNGTNNVPSHFVVPAASASFDLSGMVFPADRGVLAVYHNMDGNFFNPGATLLIAALYLGAGVPPAGIPGAAFDETIRPGQQPDYTAAGVGLDLLNLTWRLPYLSSYSAYPGAPYLPYLQSFPNYQLAQYALNTQTLAGGDDGSYLIVHWKETYATSLALIQSTNLTLAKLVPANCYSATPSGGNFDDNTQPAYNVNRHRIYRDMHSPVAPSPNTFSSAGAAGAWSTHQLSGVTFVDDTGFQFDLSTTINNLWNDSYDTGVTSSAPHIPAQFTSAFAPLRFVFSDFGGSVTDIPYYMMRKQGTLVYYSSTNAPQPSDVAEYVGNNVAIFGATANFTPNNATGYSSLRADYHKLFTSNLGVVDLSRKYLYNTFPAAGGVPGSSTPTFEGYVDEHYRYRTLHIPSGSEPILPAGGDVYNSTQSLLVDTDSLQIIGNNLVYPQEDFSAPDFYPSGGPNYSGLPGSDGVGHLRRHLRVFNTGLPRNTGKLRLRFLPLFGGVSSFTTDAAYNGAELTGHVTGGMIIQVMVPGVTGWLDLGRALGDPGLSTTDFFGCSTGVLVSGPDIFVSFQTTAFTVNNGAGGYPLLVRVSMVNNAAGRGIRLSEMEWLAP